MAERIDDLLSLYDSDDKTIRNDAFLKLLLKELRKSKIRRPDIVIDNWQSILYKESGNEIWNLYEQICQAALDIGDKILVEVCLEELVKKFPNSIRVQKLQGLYYEQQGKYEEALSLYDDLCIKHPGNLMILKRKACIYKAKGDYKQEVDEINNILKQFPGDILSWLELGNIYLAQCDYLAAAHCFEELILLNPECANYHNKLADVYYTIGGLDNFILARKHYSISLRIQASKHNLHALYSLLYTCQSIMDITNTNNTTNNTTTITTIATTTTIVNKEIKDNHINNTIIDHELKVNKQLYEWAKKELDHFNNKSNANIFKVVNNSILKSLNSS